MYFGNKKKEQIKDLIHKISNKPKLVVGIEIAKWYQKLTITLYLLQRNH